MTKVAEGFVIVLIILLAACTSQPPSVSPSPGISIPPTIIASPPLPSATLTLLPTRTLLPSLTPTPVHTPMSAYTATPSPTPAPPEFPITGIEVHRLNHLPLAAQAGAYWVRLNALKWPLVEPEQGARQWEAVAGLEQELQTIAAQGQQVILIIRDAPAWALQTPGMPCGPVKPESLGAFADFVAEAVARYSAPPFNVRYWELGNEPDVDPDYISADSPFGCWGDEDDPLYGGGYYAEMLKAVYPKIKTASPQAQVLVGGLMLDCDPVKPPETAPGSGQFKDCHSSRFLEGILGNGGGDYFDGVSFHAYDYYYGVLGQYGNSNWASAWNTTGPVITAKVHYIQGVLSAYGYSGKFLMDTENALLCGSDGSEPACQTDDYANSKAFYLAQAYAASQSLELRTNVWFSITGWRASELVTGNLTPLPAFQAFTFNASTLGQATFWGRVDDYPGVVGFTFRQEGRRVWVIWSLDGEPHPISLPEAPDSMFDVFGNPLPPGQDLTIEIAPIYLIWQP